MFSMIPKLMDTIIIGPKGGNGADQFKGRNGADQFAYLASALERSKLGSAVESLKRSGGVRKYKSKHINPAAADQNIS